ncbi:hypothetical protein D3C72_599720 [compost metagenome]
MRLVSPSEGVDFSKDVKYPVASDVYTYNLLEKHSNYRVFIDPNAKVNFQFEIQKQNEDYIINRIDGYNPFICERNELTEKMLINIKNALIPWQILDLENKGVKVKKINPFQVEKLEVNKPTGKPLFISKCE